MALSKSSPHVKSKQYLDREIRMVLVGKTGVGKSATGNTIAGGDVFNEDLCGTSVTSKCQQHSFERDGYELQLVDAPGFCDTDRSAKDINEEVGRCVALSSPGIHAILFIVHVGRFTDEDKKTIEAFIECFGEECRKYVLVIFTGKDKLDKRKKTIDEFIETSPESLKMFLSTVQGRYMAVNNNDMSSDKDTFTKELAERISQMVQFNGGSCYTNKMYEKAEIQLKKAEDEKVIKSAAANKARDDKLIEEKLAEMEAAFTKQLLCKEELARKKEEEEKCYRAQLEDDRRKESRREMREEIATKSQGFWGFLGAAAGATLGGTAGFFVAGPVGAVAGASGGYAAGSAVVRSISD